MESERLETRLGPLAWRSSGHGPALVFFAGTLANGELSAGRRRRAQDRYRCITIDLPLGAHPGRCRPARTGRPSRWPGWCSDCLELLELAEATVVANDTAGRAGAAVAGHRSPGAAGAWAAWC